MDQRQAELERLIAPTIDAMGYELVRVIVSGRQRPTLQIMAERKDRKPMTVEDCEQISRMLSAKLDVEDPIPDSYTLEVSSPGIDRPLVQPRDFARFIGHLAKVEARQPIAGQRRFTGRIIASDEAKLRLALATGEVELAHGEVERAKLVLTEELIKATGQSPVAH
jgi:ribosome maturation factor RimP